VGQVLVETYRVERLIAEGGMSTVYEAAHLRVPKRFAVKFLKMSLVSNTEALLRFRREAEIIATFDHPGIVQLVDYNVTTDGQPYIVLEFLDGEHLGQRLERGKLSLEEALRITAVVSSALQAAHARDITHRDLKPDNIVLHKGDHVKVVDFGVAKLRHGPELTAMNVVVGTVEYMAPEQISGGKCDPRTDQFALASIVYSMLSGKPAFEMQGSLAAQAMRILNYQPPPIEGVPEAVNAVLQRGMAKNPFERYATVTELMDALKVAAGSTAEVAAPAADEGLPELPGEATSISTMPPPAPISNQVPPEVDLAVTPREPPLLSEIKTMQMDAVAAGVLDAEVPIPERVTLPPSRPPSLNDANTNPSTARVPRQSDEPRPTVKGMSTVQPPSEETGVFRAGDAPRARWLWIALGAFAGGALAIGAWLIMR
jgi:serine/threonine-protein kinase